MYQLIEHPAPPATTLSGDTKGPCVHAGSARFAGQPIYLGEQEIRGVLKAFGWPMPETHAAVVADRDAAVEMVDRVERELAEARDHVAALETLVGIQQADAEPAAAVPAEKTG